MDGSPPIKWPSTPILLEEGWSILLKCRQGYNHIHEGGIRQCTVKRLKPFQTILPKLNSLNLHFIQID